MNLSLCLTIHTYLGSPKWPVRAAERFQGPFNKHLANPILLIGNEADPITPFDAAQRSADLLGNSATLIQQDDFGHVSISLRSNCTMGAVFIYFTQGKVRETGNWYGLLINELYLITVTRG